MYICGELKTMYKFLISTLIAAVAFTACQQPDNKSAVTDAESAMKDSTKFTTIQWQDSVVNFGTKKMGDIVDVTFNCTNTGNKLLYLYDVRPGCGCTLVDYSKEPIKPGEQGKIEAKLDTKKTRVGEVHKVVFVHSNTRHQIPYLSFTGTISDSSASKK